MHDAGITWMLSDQVVAMRPSLWAAQYERLAQAAMAKLAQAVPAVRPALPAAALREWLSHQKGLRALGEAWSVVCTSTPFGPETPQASLVHSFTACKYIYEA